MWIINVVEDLHTVDLTDQERYVLVRGVAEWGGPAHSIDTLTVPMGFSSTADPHSEGRRLGEALRDRQPLTIDN
jgi:hypothetical protein